MKELHPIQLSILKKLLFANTLRYTDIKPDKELENNQFDYHLDKLIKEEFIEKNNKIYTLTNYEKEFANRMNVKTGRMKQQAKLTTVICCVNTKAQPHEYLIYTRRKHPFYGCQGFPTEKVWFGENIEEAVLRGLKEETGLNGVPKLFAVRHYKVFTHDKKLVEDKVMYVFRFENPRGELKGNEEGEFQWVKDTKIDTYIKKPLEEFFELLTLLKKNFDGINFKELTQVTDKF